MGSYRLDAKNVNIIKDITALTTADVPDRMVIGINLK